PAGSRPGPLRERRARVLAADRGREGAARGARPRGREARGGRGRCAHPRGRTRIVDSLTLARRGPLAGRHPAGLRGADRCAGPARGHGYDVENQRVATLATKHPDRLVAFARVDPLAPVATTGASGLFLHPWEDTFRVTDSAVDAVLDGRPVIVATGYPFMSEALQVAELARRHPETTFVATNGGQINISGLGHEDAFL